MQETRVLSLIQEGPIGHKAAKPACHSYWTQQPGSHNYWAPAAVTEASVPENPQQQEKPLQWVHGLQLESRFCSLELEESPHGSEDHAQTKMHK